MRHSVARYEASSGRRGRLNAIPDSEARRDVWGRQIFVAGSCAVAADAGVGGVSAPSPLEYRGVIALLGFAVCRRWEGSRGLCI